LRKFHTDCKKIRIPQQLSARFKFETAIQYDLPKLDFKAILDLAGSASLTKPSDPYSGEEKTMKAGKRAVAEKSMETRISFKNRSAFRLWLEKNCLENDPIWIEFYKDGTVGISYQEALEEALAFGWIDSLIKKIDDRVYVRKFSKRKKGSRWSDTNKKIVDDLIKNGLMTKYGQDAVDEAKKNGQWYKEDERNEYINIEGLRDVLIRTIDNIDEFDALSDSLKKHYSLVYFAAKREETRNKRLEMIVEYMKTKKRFL
jgi:uncharacterized protein YdeI (YjbR/CyaY-like superfamily)